jgi:serine phosphatase RsbU (regulator of sigma subunit)/pSer/pThr/pTyr-binding forkhead associated (FHA) protein
MAELTLQSADGSRERYPLSRPSTVIGRSRQSDIVLPDPSLSRRHAEIEHQQDGFYLRDLGSTNGTRLNGMAVTQAVRLTAGDRITLGDVLLDFLSEATPAEDAGVQDVMAFSGRRLSDPDTWDRLDDAVGRQRKLVELLTRAAQSLLAHGAIEDLFGFVLDQVMEAIPAERGAILMLEGEPARLAMKACRSWASDQEGTLRVSRSISQRVIERQVSLLLPKVLEDQEFRSRSSIINLGIRSAICAPLWLSDANEERVIGLVYLDTLSESHVFSHEDLRVLTALANLAASKIETARLFRESLEKRRIEQDLRMAAELQRSLLPRAAPDLPGYSLAGGTIPCRQVAGDYFDFFWDGSELRFALADVSGKGAGAALMSTSLRMTVRSVWDGPSLADAVARTNQALCHDLPGGYRYVSFFVGGLDPRSGRLRYVNAGQTPPLLAHTSGAVESLATGGMVLGLFEEVTYEEGTADLAPGDALLAFSDGVRDAWNPAEEEFGVERLRTMVLERRGDDAQTLANAISVALDTHIGSARALDDRTLIVVKRS